MAEQFSGVYPILLMPFGDAGQIDEDDLRAEIEFNLDHGVHGIGVAMASEVLKLTEAERDRVTKVVVAQVRGRVPVVINTGGPSTHPAVGYSQRAEELGADALMCQPPSLGPCTPGEIRSYFRALSDAVSIPIFIQDTAALPVPAALAKQIGEESTNVRYTKVESQPPHEMVSQNVRVAGDVLTVFGGAGATYLVEELRRGSRGTMPWPTTPRELVAIWDLMQAGDDKGATALFYSALEPLHRVTAGRMTHALQVHKEVLRRRGIFKTSCVRAPGEPLDPETLADLDRVLSP